MTPEHAEVWRELEVLVKRARWHCETHAPMETGHPLNALWDVHQMLLDVQGRISELRPEVPRG